MLSLLNRKFSDQVRNERGLTLIEIMVVLLIVGGLAATLGQVVYKNLANANVKQTRLRFGEITKALEMYNGDCGAYPTTEQGLAVLLQDPGKGVCPNWGPQAYAVKAVTLDAWNKQILYESDGSAFVLKSLGKGGREGGDGDSKDLLSTDQL